LDGPVKYVDPLGLGQKQGILVGRIGQVGKIRKTIMGRQVLQFQRVLWMNIVKSMTLAMGKARINFINRCVTNNLCDDWSCSR
jgi:hypothetical protein